MVSGWCVILFLIRWSVWFKSESTAYNNRSSKVSGNQNELGAVFLSGGDLPTKIIITFKKDRIILEYFLPEGSGNYPYIHVKETWLNETDGDKSSVDARVRLDILKGYLERGDVEIEVETDSRYAYAEFDKGRRKSRIYAYTTHEGDTT